MTDRRDQPPAARTARAAVAIAVFAVVCCAGFPLVAAVAGSIALGTLLGTGAGIFGAVMLIALIAIRVRRRRACQAHAPRQTVR